jgi:hypothetical protein
MPSSATADATKPMADAIVAHLNFREIEEAVNIRQHKAQA